MKHHQYPEERRQAEWERKLRKMEVENETVTNPDGNRCDSWPCLSAGAKDRVPETAE